MNPLRPVVAPALVSVDWLREHLVDPAVRVLDARWYLGEKRGIDAYAGGHLPGAAFVDLDRDLAAPKGTGPGRHPLPSARAFARVLARLGIGATTHVIAYDDAGGAIASRVWWLFRYFGLPRASLLDGGLAAWTEAAGPLTTEAPLIVPAAPLSLRAHSARVVDKIVVDRLRNAADAVVLDARSPERFEGKSEPIDARPGHIPGARSAPFADNLVAPGGRFRDRAELVRRFQTTGALQASQIVCYCGSGVTACHGLLVLSLLGRDDARLYEGSWSDWAADASLPSATGSL